MLKQLRTAAKEQLLMRYPGLFWAYMRKRHGAAEIEPEIDLLNYLCERGRTAVDIGAHYGIYTYYLRNHARRIYAFEPIPRLAKILRTAFSSSQVQVEQVALSKHDGQSSLRIPITNPGRSTIDLGNSLVSDLPAGIVIQKQAVTTRTLDSYELRDLAFIKIDVEGHEVEVLTGARETLIQNEPVLLIEVEDRHREGSLSAVCDLVQALGYEGWFLDDGTLVPLARFEASLHQNPERPDSYVRNFIFSTARHRAQLAPLYS